MKGNLLVALCGPFTKVQKALTLQKVQVDPTKLIAALLTTATGDSNEKTLNTTLGGWGLVAGLIICCGVGVMVSQSFL